MGAIRAYADFIRPASQAGEVTEKVASGRVSCACLLGGIFLISAALFAIATLGHMGILPIGVLGNGLLFGGGAFSFVIFAVCCCSSSRLAQKEKYARAEAELYQPLALAKPHVAE